MTIDELDISKEKLQLLDQLDKLLIEKHKPGADAPVIEKKIAEVKSDLEDLVIWPVNYFYAKALRQQILAIKFKLPVPVKINYDTCYPNESLCL